MADIEFTIPDPTQEEVDQMAAHLAVLDPNREGVTMNRLRTFYPKLGWGHIMVRLAALKAAGRATVEKRSGGGPVQFEYWTLVE